MTTQSNGTPVRREGLPEEEDDDGVLHCSPVRTSFRLGEGDAGDEHGEAQPMEATARAGGARLDGEGLPKVEDDDVLLDVGVDGAPASLRRNAGEVGEDEVAAMPREVVARSGAARHDGEGWPEFAGVVEREEDARR
jgi:hypothetical protein|uniref:DUF834 domain-containing protein n=1 Tax=Oryza sativa subsp. japonica TaxID=39947 RepID=Q2QTT6_ORYSJ|nr:hypothetical protein LOC_Os12g18570 [Oryza sativa Japonica Group]